MPPKYSDDLKLPCWGCPYVAGRSVSSEIRAEAISNCDPDCHLRPKGLHRSNPDLESMPFEEYSSE